MKGTQYYTGHMAGTITALLLNEEELDVVKYALEVLSDSEDTTNALEANELLNELKEL